MKEKLKNALKSFFGIKLSLWAVIIIFAVSLGTGWLLRDRSLRNVFGGGDSYAAAQKYLEVQKLVDDYYIGEEDKAAMSDAASAAMIKSLGDQWSYYMTPDEYAAYKLYSANQYEGVGVTITTDETSGGFEITGITPGSPAEAAGLAVGDLILAVDGQEVKGLTVSEVSTLIRAHIDESVALTIKNAAGTNEVAVDCAVIYSDPVSFELLDDKVGYIRIRNFEAGAGTKAVAAVDELLGKGATSMVFDVRGNPGGLLSELITILDHLLPEGDIFVSVNEAGEETVTKSDNVCIDMPMSVIVDKDSYSAAEFFAAALKDFGWATVVGQQTTGKGRSQITVVLSDGSAVHISNNKYLTPDRVDLSEQGGLTPDIVAEYDPAAKADGQIEAAVNAVLGKG